MSNYKKSLWERFQDQKQEPWPFIDFDEFKGWYDKQEKMRKVLKMNESKKITEQLLVDLGFKKVDVSEEEAGGTPFYYFTFDFTDRGVFSLISNASNEVEEDSWTVEIFEDAEINFNSKTLTKFMNVMKEVLNESNS